MIGVKPGLLHCFYFKHFRVCKTPKGLIILRRQSVLQSIETLIQKPGIEFYVARLQNSGPERRLFATRQSLKGVCFRLF